MNQDIQIGEIKEDYVDWIRQKIRRAEKGGVTTNSKEEILAKAQKLLK